MPFCHKVSEIAGFPDSGWIMSWVRGVLVVGLLVVGVVENFGSRIQNSELLALIILSPLAFRTIADPLELFQKQSNRLSFWSIARTSVTKRTAGLSYPSSAGLNPGSELLGLLSVSTPKFRRGSTFRKAAILSGTQSMERTSSVSSLATCAKENGSVGSVPRSSPSQCCLKSPKPRRVRILIPQAMASHGIQGFGQFMGPNSGINGSLPNGQRSSKRWNF